MCIDIASLFLVFQSINWWQSSVHIYWNWMVTVFLLHISATLHLTIFCIWSNTIQSLQYVICVMIVREIWSIGLAIRYTIWIAVHLCTSRGTFLRIQGKTSHCLPLTRLPRFAVGAPAVNPEATAIWLVLRVLAVTEHCNMCDENPGSEYIFIFYVRLRINASKIWFTYLQVYFLYPCQILQAYKP